MQRHTWAMLSFPQVLVLTGMFLASKFRFTECSASARQISCRTRKIFHKWKRIPLGLGSAHTQRLRATPKNDTLLLYPLFTLFCPVFVSPYYISA